jgi:hypothetical protein
VRRIVNVAFVADQIPNEAIDPCGSCLNAQRVGAEESTGGPPTSNLEHFLIN